MLFRKIRSYIENHLVSGEDRILLIEGARQIGKSYFHAIIKKGTPAT